MNSTELRILRAAIKAFPAVVPHLKGRARWVLFATSLAAPRPICIDIKGNVRTWGELKDIKSYDYFLQQLERLIRSVYEGNLGGEFMDIMANLISGQLTDAYQTAIDEAGLSPDEVTDEMKQQLDDFIVSEYDHVDGLYQDIVDARVDETPLEPLLERAQLWAGRWTDVYNAAKLEISAELGEKMMWNLGATEHHCPKCIRLNGIVLFASEWQELDVRPQNPPNPALTGEVDGEKCCEGWRCDCSLDATEQRRSPNGFDTVLNIVSL